MTENKNIITLESIPQGRYFVEYHGDYTIEQLNHESIINLVKSTNIPADEMTISKRRNAFTISGGGDSVTLKPFTGLCLCESCMNALYSRGERFSILEGVYLDDEITACDWCNEEADELTPIK